MQLHAFVLSMCCVHDRVGETKLLLKVYTAYKMMPPLWNNSTAYFFRLQIFFVCLSIKLTCSLFYDKVQHLTHAYRKLLTSHHLH